MKYLIAIIIAVSVGVVVPTNTSNKTSAEAPQCQYPTRPLKDGNCDNSDPCDPTTLKDPVLHGDCAPQPAPVSPPVTQPTPQPVTQQPSQICSK